MKIITASKFYYQRAGLESYLFKITDILRSQGHEVIPFSTTYKENIKSEYERFFTEYIALGGEENTSFYNKIRALGKIVYNVDARNKISKLMDYTKPDLLWGFGVHRHLSPAIFMEAKSRSIPVIHRLSDYAIICPDSRLTKGDGSNCNLLCPLDGYHNAIKHGCVRQARTDDPNKDPSSIASAIGAFELYVHSKFKAYVNNVDKFIAPSNFLMNTMVKAGIPKDKLTHVPIFIDSSKYEPEYNSQAYFVYVGRLSREKGLPVLLEVMGKLRNYNLVIVGDGPQREYLEQLKSQKSLDNVKFIGKQHGDALKRIVRNSRFMIVPSTWYENSPNVLLEAYALGKPVLAANIGGIPEYVQVNKNGILFEPNNKSELEEKISKLMDNKVFSEEMGKNARVIVEKEYNPEIHYDRVISTMKNIGVR